MTEVDTGELDKLADTPVTALVDGRLVEITPIRVAELPRMIKACAPVFGHLSAGDVEGALLMDADSAIEAVAIGARMPREDLDKLGLDDLIELGAAVLRVNADFFARRLAPRLVAASETFAVAMTGLNPSPDSSAQDTAGKT